MGFNHFRGYRDPTAKKALNNILKEVEKNDTQYRPTMMKICAMILNGKDLAEISAEVVYCDGTIRNLLRRFIHRSYNKYL